MPGPKGGNAGVCILVNVHVGEYHSLPEGEECNSAVMSRKAGQPQTRHLGFTYVFLKYLQMLQAPSSVIHTVLCLKA